MPLTAAQRDAFAGPLQADRRRWAVGVNAANRVALSATLRHENAGREACLAASRPRGKARVACPHFQ